MIGRIVGERWEIGARIGMGGMASVHEGLDHRLGRLIAVKVLHPHIAESADARERLAREARAIAQLKHENIIEVYDFAIDDPECTWLVSELIEGASLRQIVERIEKPHRDGNTTESAPCTAIMPEVAVMIVIEILRALRAAHARGIIHRDVKPDNVLVGKEGRPKLSDFGIAQIVHEQRMTLTGHLVGSPCYMSPEQARAERTDHRTDLYSAGTVLYRLVTGTLPFRGGTAMETIRQVTVGAYVDPTERVPECAGAVAAIIRRALAFNIAERYQTADEMLVDCLAVLQDSALTATSEELPKFFADPERYQAELRPRLASELERRGRALMAAGQESRAMDCFNRSLSLGAGSQHTVDIVRELSKRRGAGRARKLARATAMAVAAIAAISGVLLATDRPDATPIVVASVPRAIEPHEAFGSEPVVTHTEVASAPVEREPEASKPVEVAIPTKMTTTKAPKPAPEKKHAQAAPSQPTVTPPVNAKPTETAPAATGILHVGARAWVEIWVDGKQLGTAPDQSRYILTTGAHKLKAVKPNCAPFERDFAISAGETTRLRVDVDCG